jgi:hypothetical protein
MMLRHSVFARALVVTFLMAACVAYGTEDRESAKLAEALKGTRVSLEAGLSVSERVGIPISGEFEVTDGSLELTVYVVTGSELLDVTVDPKTGMVTSVEPIARAATEHVVQANPGFRAVSVVPTMKDGHPLAELVLVRGQEFKEIVAVLE